MAEASGPIFIDASLFLGMHAASNGLRSACKAFFVRHFCDEVFMSLEQVGLCDDIIWRHPRAIQDQYYPFMDLLQSEMRIRRIPYADIDVSESLTPRFDGASVLDRLLLAQVRARGGVLYSPRHVRLKRYEGSIIEPDPRAALDAGSQAERVFPERLEILYRTSLALRLDLTELRLCPGD